MLSGPTPIQLATKAGGIKAFAMNCRVTEGNIHYHLKAVENLYAIIEDVGALVRRQLEATQSNRIAAGQLKSVLGKSEMSVPSRHAGVVLSPRKPSPATLGQRSRIVRMTCGSWNNDRGPRGARVLYLTNASHSATRANARHKAGRDRLQPMQNCT
jgi:hypothetical protein